MSGQTIEGNGCALDVTSTLFAVALVVARTAQRAQVGQHQREIGTSCTGEDVIDTCLATVTHRATAAGAAPAVTLQGLMPQPPPCLRAVERIAHRRNRHSKSGFW